MAEPALIGQDVAQARMTDSLRLFVGVGRRYSIPGLAAATLTPERTIKSYAGGEATPGFATLLRLMAFLPTGFSDQLLAPAGLGVWRTDGAHADGNLAQSQVSRRAYLLAKAMEDRRIDHQERPELVRECRELASELMAFAAGLEGAAP